MPLRRLTALLQHRPEEIRCQLQALVDVGIYHFTIVLSPTDRCSLIGRSRKDGVVRARLLFRPLCSRAVISVTTMAFSMPRYGIGCSSRFRLSHYAPERRQRLCRYI